MKADRESYILGSILFVTAMLFGGFYEFTSCLAILGLGGYLFWRVRRKKEICLYWNSALILAVVIVIGHALTVIWAVDSGMAFLGVVKFLPLVLFVIAVMQFTDSERKKLLLFVPVANVVIVGAAVLFYWIPAVREHLFMAGRLGGTFQYSNTMALYFLVGILIVEEQEKFSVKTAVIVIVQLLGIFMTGSRSVFVIAALVLLVCAWKYKDYRYFNLVIWGAAVVGGAVYACVTSDFQNLGRFLTISAGSSTFLGRFLYWQDALPLILKHPFGLGYMGYYYSQGQIQTGVYSTLFVHNDILQIVLDIGWIPTVFTISVFIKNVFLGKTNIVSKIILIVIGIHSLFDFDLQFLSVSFLCFLVMEYDDEKKKVILKKQKTALLSGMGAAMAVGVYFLIPLLASYAGNQRLAVKMYPYYTEAQIAMLEKASSREEGEMLADSILQHNKNVALAHDAKALAKAMDGEFDEMVSYKENAIQNNPYEMYEYVDYLALLDRAIEYYDSEGNEEERAGYIEKALEIPDKLEVVKNRTSRLGFKIKDKPELELPEELQQYLEELQKIN